MDGTILKSMFSEFLYLGLIDGVILLLFAALLVPLSRYNRAAFAVLRRNFIGYFSDPTGYAFLCLFVLLTSFEAFWPHEFFNSNLANLDQLNRTFPLVMLVFIPAITMSIWAEERRQGTDELLLTLPAADADIVTGKFLAAAAVYTCSLLFAQISSYLVLVSLTYGDLDTGLICSTFFGYWLVGIAMLATGMVASFLTRNLTVGFILGALFNAPLVFAAYSDVIVPRNWEFPVLGSVAQWIARWSMAAKLDDLGRGVISLSSIVYFLMITMLGLYLSMVLIGSRHWVGGRDSGPRTMHYLLRSILLVVIGCSVTILCTTFDVRKDATLNRVSSLSPDTLQILDELKSKHTIYIDAFVGTQIPEDYVKTRFTLVSILKEFQSKAKGKIELRLQENVEPFSEVATLAERQFGIRPQTVRTRSRGVFKEEPVILGAAFTCGLEKVVVPFFDYGIPVEYELVRSISTVAKGERKRLGIVNTDAKLEGGFDLNGGSFRQIPKQQIVEELEKQYDVSFVSPANLIDVKKYDVLMVVQPSSLAQPELNNVLLAIQSGLPTAIFEDPLPVMIQAPGTGDPKRPAGGMFGGGAPPTPKGDIDRFFRSLGVKMDGRAQGPGVFQANVVWQSFNPYKKIQVSELGDEFVFVHPDAPGASDPLNSEDPITQGLMEVLFPYPGNFDKVAESKNTFTPLVRTGKLSGTLPAQDVREGQQDPHEFQNKHLVSAVNYTLAARITSGKDSTEKDGSKKAPDDSSSDSSGAVKKDATLDVVVVGDIDLMSTTFVRIRAQPDQEVNWRFENVTFVLNVIDSLSRDDAYVGVRKRKPKYSSLKVIEQQTAISREEERKEREKYEEENKLTLAKAEQEAKAAKQQAIDALSEIEARQKSGERIDPSKILALQQKRQLAEDAAERTLAITRERLKNELTKKTEQIRRQMDAQIQKIQNKFKILAVILPPIPPLLVGLVVFVKRRLREREGIAKTRMR